MVAAKRRTGTTNEGSGIVCDLEHRLGFVCMWYEDRHSKWLISCQHHSFRCRSARHQILFKIDANPKGENKYPDKILPGDHKGWENLFLSFFRPWVANT